MFHLICTTFVPAWRGLPLPDGVRASLGWRLRWSYLLADGLALLYHGRTFELLTVCQREALLQTMLCHSWPLVRHYARLWKQLALLTA